MKKLVLFILSIAIVASFIGCESDNKLGLDESVPAMNFRMISDIASFNILEGDPEVTFTMYTENRDINNVTILVELFQFAPNTTTPRAVLSQINGSALKNDGSSKLTLNLSDFTSAVGVNLNDLAGGDIFTIYNIVEMNNGTIYPDTVFIDTDGDGDIDPFLNIENSFTGGTSSFVAQLGFPIVCPVSSAFTGTYAITDDQGLWVGNVVVEQTGPAQRTFKGNWGSSAGLDFDDIGFAFDLVCGSIFVAEQSIGLGCGGGSDVDVVTSTDLGPGTYNDADDSEFTINVTYSNADCFGGFDSVLNFVKQ
jgi:hypothetical protein